MRHDASARRARHARPKARASNALPIKPDIDEMDSTLDGRAGCRAPLTSIIITTPGAMESMGVGISVTCGLWLAERQRSWDLAVSERTLAYADL